MPLCIWIYVIKHTLKIINKNTNYINNVNFTEMYSISTFSNIFFRIE